MTTDHDSPQTGDSDDKAVDKEDLEVRIDVEPPIVTFTICRPHVRNALDLDSISALSRLVAGLEARPDIQVLIIDSEGTQAFIAGGDVRQFATMRGEVAGRTLSQQMGNILMRLEALPQIVIAAINGDAYGGGVELALACDIRVMDRNAHLGFTQVRFGLTSGWGGASRLVDLVGYSRAIDMMINARVLDAETCERWGLVNYLVDDHQAYSAARAMAARIVQLGRPVTYGVKRVASAGARLPREDAIAEEREIFARLWASKLHESKVDTFLRRELGPPRDVDLDGEG